MKLTRYEMESIVLYNAEEQTATLYMRDKDGHAENQFIRYLIAK